MKVTIPLNLVEVDAPPGDGRGGSGGPPRIPWAIVVDTMQPGQWYRFDSTQPDFHPSNSQTQVLTRAFGLETCLRGGKIYARKPAE